MAERFLETVEEVQERADGDWIQGSSEKVEEKTGLISSEETESS